MVESVKELIESLPNEGIDCRGNKWTRIERHGKMLNLEGQRFTRLIALFPVKIEKHTKPRWLCLCDCSKYVCVDVTHLRNENTRSCGCLHKDVVSHMFDEQREKVIGKRFGRLTALSFEGVHNERAVFKCRCDCGSEIIVSGNSLVSGKTTSCGCLQKEITSHMNDEYRQEMIGKNFGFLKVLSFDKI